MKDDAKYPSELTELRELVQTKLKEKKNESRIPNWTHISGGAESGSTWQRSINAYKSIGFDMKAISGVNPDETDLSADIFGSKYSLPFSAAPMSAAISFTCENAFAELAKGCGRLGTPASIGYPTGESAHKRMLETGVPLIRLIKPLRDIDKLIEELKTCESEGCIATGIDTDSAAGLKPSGDSGHFGEIARPYSVSELKTVIKGVDIPFIVKGVLSVSDAVAAVESGADAIVISTHAGYAMDYCRSPLEVLSGIRNVVGKDVKIIVDSGITRGSDIIKAIALGADFVFLGRLMIWGLLIGGAEGIEWIGRMLEKEMSRIMTLLGVSTLGELNTDCLVSFDALGEVILGRRDP